MHIIWSPLTTADADTWGMWFLNILDHNIYQHMHMPMLGLCKNWCRPIGLYFSAFFKSFFLISLEMRWGTSRHKDNLILFFYSSSFSDKMSIKCFLSVTAKCSESTWRPSDLHSLWYFWASCGTKPIAKWSPVSTASVVQGMKTLSVLRAQAKVAKIAN